MAVRKAVRMVGWKAEQKVDQKAVQMVGTMECY